MDRVAFTTHLRAAVMRQRIYPATSPAVREAVTQVYQEINEAFKEKDELRITRNGEKFFVDMAEVPQAGHLVALLEDHHIQGLILMRGLTLEEMLELVACLSRKQPPDESFGDWLLAQNVTHARVNELSVVELADDQAVVGKGFSQFQNISSHEQLEETLTGAMEYIDKVPEEAQRNYLGRQLALRLSTLQTDMIRDLLDSGREAGAGRQALLRTVLEAVSVDRLTEMLNEVCRWELKIRQTPGPVKEMEEQRASLRDFAARLMEAPAISRVPRPLLADLHARGLIDAVPEGTGGDAESVEAELETLLREPDEGFLTGIRGQGLPAALAGLFAVGAGGRVPALLDRLFRVLRNGAPALRQRAAAVARELQPILWANDGEDQSARITDTLLEQADLERGDDRYEEILRGLIQAALHDYRSQSMDPLKAILSLLRRHAWEKDPLAEKRREEAGRAMRKVLEDLMDLLVEDLASGDPARSGAAAAVVREMQEKAVPVLVDIVRTCRDVRRRHMAAERLKAFPAAASAALGAELNVANSSQEILNVVSALPDFATEAILPGLTELLYYPDADVRREVVRLLGHVPGPKALELTQRFLQDGEAGVRQAAVRALGEKRWEPAAILLIGLVKEGPDALVEEACLALGKIRSELAVEPLSRLLTPGSQGLFNRARKLPGAVRVRAAWALRAIGTPAALEKLALLRDDPEPLVREIARDKQAS